MSTSNKLLYLNTTKTKIREGLNTLGADLDTEDTFRSYADAIENIYEDYPKITGEGESLTLDNTKQAPMKIDYKGNTSQETTTGKNLLNSTGFHTTTVNGVTLTPTFKDNELQYVTINGTATETTVFEQVYYTTTTNNVLNGCVGGSNSTYKLDFWTTGNLYPIYDGESVTLPDNTSGKIRIVVYNGKTVNNVKIYPMIRLSSVTDDTYEPYTNGASPNPSYPQDVNVVSGDNEINICGKNLLDISTFVKGRINNTTGNLEYANNVSSMVIGENNISFVVSQAWNSGIASEFIPISTGNYVFKYSHNREITICIDTYDNQKTRIARIDAFTQTQTPTTRTFTISDSNVKYIRIHFEVNTANVEFIVSEMQLEKGSTATTYEPYIGKSYPIYLGVENLFDKSNITWSRDNGIIYNSVYVGFGTYTMSSPNMPYDSSGKNMFVLAGNVSSGANSNTNGVDKDTPRTITTTDGYITIANRYILSNALNLNHPEDYDWQLEKGSKQNNFTPYGTTPIELCKIGDYQDYFIKSDGRNLFDNTYNDLGMWITNIGETTTFAQGSQYLGAYCKVEPGTYTISRNKKTNRFRIGVSPNQPTGTTSSCYVVASNDNASSITIDVPQGNNYICIYLSNNSEASTNVDLMIEKGSSASDYQPYGVGKWYLHKEIGKVVLDETENWGQSGTYTNDTIYSVYSGIIDNYNNGQAISDLFVWNGSISGSTTTEYIATGGNTLRIGVLKSRLSAYTINDFKNWLSNNNVTTYYVLATPTTTEITYQPLIDQLNLLEKSMSKDGQTNISQVNNDLPFNLDVKALRGE